MQKKIKYEYEYEEARRIHIRIFKNSLYGFINNEEEKN